MSEVIRARDCALALKGNQGTLHDDVVRVLDDRAATSKPVIDTGHGRVERERSPGFKTRTASVLTDVGWLQEQHRWPGLAAIGKVRRLRETAAGATTAAACCLFGAALLPDRLNEVARLRGARTNCTGGWTSS